MQVAEKGRPTRSLAILGTLCLVLQLALAPNVALWGGRANFAVVFLLASAPMLDQRGATIAGFLAGLVFDLTSTSPVGLMALCLCVAGYVLSMDGAEGGLMELGPSLLRGAVLSLAVFLVFHLAMLVVGRADSLIDVVFLRALPSTLLTTVALVPFLWLSSRSRGAGRRLGTAPRKGGHFGRGI